MKKKKWLIFTFDHELFLGSRSGTVQKCMIDPVNALFESAGEIPLRHFIFFVDVTYLAALKRKTGNVQFQKDYTLVKNQIHQLLDSGHYVFPHIHPHWIDAEEAENHQWKLSDLKHYRFASCSSEIQNQVWSESMDVMLDLGVSNYHTIDGYRAGGWSIQPFSEFKSFFNQSGIIHDFSVLPGTYANTNAQCYDFRNAPSNKTHYRFKEDPAIEDASGSLYEWPISVREVSAQKSIRERLLLKWLYKTGNRSFGDGQGVIPTNLTQSENTKQCEMMSIELLNAATYKRYAEHIDQHDYTQFISHPKMLSRHNLKYFSKLLQYSFKNYTLEFDFRTLLNA